MLFSINDDSRVELRPLGEFDDAVIKFLDRQEEIEWRSDTAFYHAKDAATTKQTLKIVADAFDVYINDLTDRLCSAVYRHNTNHRKD